MRQQITKSLIVAALAAISAGCGAGLAPMPVSLSLPQLSSAAAAKPKTTTAAPSAAAVKTAVLAALTPADRARFGEVLDVNESSKPGVFEVHFYLNNKQEGCTTDYYGNFDARTAQFKVTSHDQMDCG